MQGIMLYVANRDPDRRYGRFGRRDSSAFGVAPGLSRQRGAELVQWTERTMRWAMIGAASGLSALVGCAWQGPSLGGYPGAQYAVTSYYANNAIEKNMSCTQPAMTPMRTEILADDGKQVKMLVQYHWYPNNMQSRGMAQPGQNRSSPNTGFCNGSSERTFTFARNTDGTLTVVSMTGPQRRGGAAG
jgi:hypothetical protein